MAGRRAATAKATPTAAPPAFWRQLHVQVLFALVVAVALGLAVPTVAVQMKPLGDAFIALLRMMLAPIIFCAVVLGLAQVRDLGQLGRLGLKSLIYFEVISTVAMLVGFGAANLFRPGDGLHATQLATTEAVTQASSKAGAFSVAGFFLHIIPTTMVDAFARGEILQVMLVSVLVGAALTAAPADSLIVRGIAEGQSILGRMLGFLMRLAPIGAFGAMAAAVGAHGGATMIFLLRFLLVFGASCLFFVVVVLGLVCLLARLSLWQLFRLVRDEMLIVLGTASAETIIARLMFKLERAGCDRATVGFVIPAGYSFNLDGTCLYMALAIGFIAQITDTPFGLGQQLSLLAVMLLTSKGGTAMAGGAFVKLAGTLQTSRVLPLEGLGLLFGVDRIVSTIITLTNLIGNTVATFVIAEWEGGVDRARLAECLAYQASGGKIEDLEAHA